MGSLLGAPAQRSCEEGGDEDLKPALSKQGGGQQEG